MSAEESASGHRRGFHHLPEKAVDALLAGDGDSKTLEQLRRTELSRRLLLLRALLDQADGRYGVPNAWSLLEDAQRRAPDIVERLLAAPGTGIWLSRALRSLRGRTSDGVPVHVTVGHLSALAAAAATRVGAAFSVTVPVHGGFIHLPSLGCAVLASAKNAEDKEWGAVRVTGRDGVLRLTDEQDEIVVAPPWDRRSVNWLPTRRVTVGPDGRQMSLVLEEHDPYRTYAVTSAPRDLPEEEETDWRRYLDDAWRILLRDEPVAAEAMRHGLASLTPSERAERFRPYSSSAGDAFAGLNASLPYGGAQLASTLVHEFQHIKLGSLIHLYPLLRAPAEDGTEGGEGPQFYHAPWRDDPRPLDGLLQGIYAFFGVARFWRAHRHSADPAEAPVAHFEYTFWRDQVRTTIEEVRGHERLTALGARMLAALGERCARWAADPADDVPADVSRLATELAVEHRARWREHHLRPPAAAVTETVRAWRRGDPRPPTAITEEPRLMPDPGVRFLDVGAVLARHELARTGPAVQNTGEGGIRGAGTTDLLLSQGDREAARQALVAELRTGHAPVGSWAVLGRATAGDPVHRDASRLLCRFPERARAVGDALRDQGAEPPDPLRLASWLAAGLAAE